MKKRIQSTPNKINTYLVQLNSWWIKFAFWKECIFSFQNYFVNRIGINLHAFYEILVLLKRIDNTKVLQTGEW